MKKDFVEKHVDILQSKVSRKKFPVSAQKLRYVGTILEKNSHDTQR